MKTNKLKTKVIIVTEHDIQHGIQRSFTECPVARATRRAFCYKKRCRVDGDGRIFIGKKGSRSKLQKVESPNQIDIQNFVYRFDASRPVTTEIFKIMYS